MSVGNFSRSTGEDRGGIMSEMGEIQVCTVVLGGRRVNRRNLKSQPTLTDLTSKAVKAHKSGAVAGRTTACLGRADEGDRSTLWKSNSP